MKARSLLFLRSAFGLALCVALPGISAAQTRTLRADVDVTPDIQGDINTAVSNLGRQTIADVLPEPWKNWNGSRRWLAERGVTFAATYQNDIMAAISGGAKRGSTYYGRLLGTVEWDPEYATGWKGATFHFSFWQMHGVGISTHFVQSLSALSDLEGVATTRWSDVWLEQKFGDLLAVRAGKISADTEFFQSLFYGLGIGGAFGWAAILGANLPNGGIAFPFASPGVRVKITPHPQWTFLTAVFDGDPVGPGTGNPQIRNRYGTNFRLRDPAFAMAEAQWNYSTEWPGTLRLGAWKHIALMLGGGGARLEVYQNQTRPLVDYYSQWSRADAAKAPRYRAIAIDWQLVALGARRRATRGSPAAGPTPHRARCARTTPW